jgi:hypothetical protein
LGDNLAHYVNDIEPLLRHNQAHIPINHPAITDSPTPAQPLTGARRLATTTSRRVPVHNRAQASARNVRDNRRPHLPSPPMRAPQPQERANNNSPAEAAQPPAIPLPNSNSSNNPADADQPANEGRPVHGTGKRAQKSARLRAAGKCIWCRKDNPDKSRMGCPECRRRRVKMTERWRQRVLARDEEDARAQARDGPDGEGKQDGGEDSEDHELEGWEDNGKEDSE